MDELSVMSKNGKITLLPGEVFQAVDKAKSACKYQYLGLTNCVGEKYVYLHDDTHGKFCDVRLSWFMNRSIRRIGGEDNGE